MNQPEVDRKLIDGQSTHSVIPERTRQVIYIPFIYTINNILLIIAQYYVERLYNDNIAKINSTQ